MWCNLSFMPEAWPREAKDASGNPLEAQGDWGEVLTRWLGRSGRPIRYQVEGSSRNKSASWS